jgi:hypothetical protein
MGHGRSTYSFTHGHRCKSTSSGELRQAAEGCCQKLGSVRTPIGGSVRSDGRGVPADECAPCASDWVD